MMQIIVEEEGHNINETMNKIEMPLGNGFQID
jgi:hypothetical protein